MTSRRWPKRFGTAACRYGFSVRYARTTRLLHTLDQSRPDGAYPALLRTLARTDLLILDDWMRDALTLPDARDLLEILDDRFGVRSTILATQVPVAEWHARIPVPTPADAILDRLAPMLTGCNWRASHSASCAQFGLCRTLEVQ